MVRQTCVVEVGQQLFFLHEPLIQPVSQGLCLHRNLFYGVHPEGKRQEDREMKHTHKKRGITEVSLSRNCLHSTDVKAAVQTQVVSPGPWTAVYLRLESITAVYVFTGASVFERGSSFSWQAHQSFRGRQTCWVEPWQETDKMCSSTKWFG